MTLALSKLNFRDVGGLPAGPKQQVRRGIVFRSEGPANFIDEHRAELGELGFRSVCDLRSAGEREKAPNDWCGPHCRLLHLDMNSDVRAQGEDVWTPLRKDPSEATARRVMTEIYCTIPEALSPHLVAIADALLAGEVPMMIHCTAGKDRTGVTVAVLLTLAGVSREDILKDYKKSDIFGENMRLSGSLEAGLMRTFGLIPSDAVVQMLVGAEQDFLVAALDELNRRWGDVPGFFAASGVTADTQAKLRHLLLEPRDAANSET